MLFLEYLAQITQQNIHYLHL